MTLRRAYNIFATVVLVALMVAAVFLWNYDPAGERSTIPPPPSGYEYCDQNGYLNFCPKGTS